MIFNNSRPIYLQILELINYKIMHQEWLPDERIPSVRDLAMEYEVNPNTVMRAYERLQNEQIIYKRRGLGYYLSADAKEKILLQTKEEFITEELPKFFSKLDTFGVTIKDLEELYAKHKT